MSQVSPKIKCKKAPRLRRRGVWAGRFHVGQQRWKEKTRGFDHTHCVRVSSKISVSQHRSSSDVGGNAGSRRASLGMLSHQYGYQLHLQQHLWHAGVSVRIISRLEHKRRNNLVILCKLRLATRLLYFCSISLRRQFLAPTWYVSVKHLFIVFGR